MVSPALPAEVNSASEPAMEIRCACATTMLCRARTASSVTCLSFDEVGACVGAKNACVKVCKTPLAMLTRRDDGYGVAQTIKLKAKGIQHIGIFLSCRVLHPPLYCLSHAITEDLQTTNPLHYCVMLHYSDLREQHRELAGSHLASLPRPPPVWLRAKHATHEPLVRNGSPD